MRRVKVVSGEARPLVLMLVLTLVLTLALMLALMLVLTPPSPCPLTNTPQPR